MEKGQVSDGSADSRIVPISKRWGESKTIAGWGGTGFMAQSTSVVFLWLFFYKDQFGIAKKKRKNIGDETILLKRL